MNSAYDKETIYFAEQDNVNPPGINREKISMLVNQNTDVGVVVGFYEEGYPLYFINRFMLSNLGFESYDEFMRCIGGNYINAIYPDDRAAFVMGMNDERCTWLEYRVVSREGILVWVNEIFIKSTSKDGKRLWIGSVRIVDELHRMSVLNQQILSVVGNMYTGIYQVDLITGAVFCLKGAASQPEDDADFRFDLWINRIVSNYHPDDRDRLMHFLDFETLISENRLGTGELEEDFRCMINGDYLWFSHTIIFDKNTGRNGIVILLQRDVSSRYEKYRLLSDALESAQNANIAQRNFLFRMSRDIRVPLNAIINMTKLAIANMEDPVKLKKYLCTVNESGNHLLRLVDGILDIDEIESGNLRLECNALNVEDMVREIQSITEQSLMNKAQNLVVQYENLRHKQIIGDKEKLNKIMINLISNASELSDEGSIIEFTIAELPVLRNGYGKYRFDVKDHGMGIAENVRNRIFEPFEETDYSDKNLIPYAGIGLAMTKDIVDLMKGSIDVESTLGEGSCFTVVLEFKLNEEYIQQGMDADNDISGMKILLVEDNELNMEIACELLDMNDVIVSTACNGQEAIDVFARSGKDAFDLIMMDIQMPVKNGYEAVDGIRALVDIGGDVIPIIAVTADVFTEDVKLAGSHGMNGHLSKPLDFEQVKTTLARFKKNPPKCNP